MTYNVKIYGVDLANAKPFCKNFKDDDSFTEWMKTYGKDLIVHSMKIDECYKVISLGLSELRLWGIYQIITIPGIRKRLPRLTKLAYELYPEKF